MNRTRFCVCIVIFFSVFVLFQIPLFAGINVDPVVAEIVASRSAENTQILKVTNTGKNKMRVRVELDKSKKTDIDLNTWLNVSPMEAELDPGRELDFSYTVKLPKDADGEFRAMIFLVADELGQKKSMFGIRFGVPVYAIVKETVKLDAEIKDIKIGYDTEKGSVEGTAYIKNKGNIHIRPFVNVNIVDENKDKKGSVNIPFGQPAQTGQNRAFRFKKEISLPPGKYIAEVTADYGRMYGQKGMVATKEAEFEVKPAEGKADKITADAGP